MKIKKTAENGAKANAVSQAASMLERLVYRFYATFLLKIIEMFV